MSENRKPRPETHEELPGYQTGPVELARMQLMPAGGVLAAADRLIASYQAVPELAGSVMSELTDDRQLVIRRQRTDRELDEALTAAQAAWDKDNKLFAEADARAALKVGDPLDVANVRDSLYCGYVYRKTSNAAPCSLDMNHKGDHFEVVDGLIARITPR
ncbi:hypothetical protein L3Q67_01105 [Saccharothrix sp. AJ9571]|nr:hypothetical protein L3Q67_01105 [Saccharothrix sp. AJ9571]